VTVWLPVLVPALVGTVTFALGESRQRARNAVNLGGAALAIAVVVRLVWLAYHGEAASSAIPMLPGLALGMSADLLGLLFAAVATVLWGVTLVYAIGYMDHASDRARFFGFFAWCIAAANGVALADDPLSLFIFYEILSLTTYPLVVHSGTPEALAAGKKYLFYALGGGAALLVAVAWLATIAGQTPFTPGGALAAVSGRTAELRVIFGLFVAGFGVKAALVPLHGWLPGAMVAPAPVSSLLHAVAVVKAGVFGIIRLVNELYGPELATSLGVAEPLAVLAAVTIVFASVVALRQDDFKRRLAYSTVAQLSYITLGTALCSPLAAAGALAHLAHHAVMKITMFFTAGSVYETLHVKKVSQMPGLARRMPLTMTSFAIAAFALAGLPPLAGFASKWMLGAGAVEGGSVWAILIYVASGALAIGYMAPVLTSALREGDHRPAEGAESDPRMLWPIVTVGVLTVILGLTAGLPGSPVHWAMTAIAPSFAGWAP
jgi:multicomponent Na+:H+ antiporter subunit D